jgi:glycerol-3-phosphate dehydrogenase
MITITGGKLTTFRRMAKLTVDRLVEREAREAPCRTQEIPLGLPVDRSQLPRVSAIPESSYEPLAARYGHGAVEVLELAAQRADLARPILYGFPDLLAEVVIAVRREQARSIADVLLRRTRLGLLAGRELTGAGGAAALAPLAAVLATELGWDAPRRERELQDFAQLARAEGIAGESP